MAHFKGQAQFDQDLLANVTECLDSHNLTDFSDKFWSGFISYGQNSTVPWGKTNTSHYIENNPKIMDINITVAEQCNFESNIAYYHSLVQICQKKDWVFTNDSVTALA
jgi:hypothetical protein